MSEQRKNFDVYVSFATKFVGSVKEPTLDKIEEFCNSSNIYFEKKDLNTLNLRYDKLLFNLNTFYFVLYHDENIKTRHYYVYKYINRNDLTTNFNINFNNIENESELLEHVCIIPLGYGIIPMVLKYNMKILNPEDVVITLIKKIEENIYIKKQRSKSNVNFKLERKYFTKNFTLGRLLKDGKHYCYTVEDMVRFSTEACRKFDPKENIPYTNNACNAKKAEITAIPCGIYKVENTWSGKFYCMRGNKRINCVPKLFTVYGHQPPCFTQIAMHSGETAGWSEGCIIMSTTITSKEFGTVKNDGRALMDEIFNMIYNGYGTIEITQKVNNKDLTQEDIDRIAKGERLGEI